MYGYRQPVLPIEMELKGEGDGSEEYGVEIDDIVAKMTEVQQKVFQTASQNIKNAQVQYKDYYDKKRENPEV